MRSLRDHRLDTLLCRSAATEVWSGARLGPDGFAVPVALKTLTDDRAGAEHQRALVNEARAAAYVQHANVVQLRELVHDQGRYWLSMDLVRGWTLRAVIAEVEASGEVMGGPIALSLVLDAAAGLQAIHDAGLLHRNVTPDNLMATTEGHAMVLDFGAASWQLAERVRFTPIADPVDPAYASPELRARAPVDVRADVYSLGALLRQLVPRRADLPVALDGIIRRALDPDPSVRFASVRGLEVALELVAIREGWLVPASYVAAFLADVMRKVPPVALAPRARPVERAPSLARPRITADGSLVLPARERTALVVPAPRVVVPPIAPPGAPRAPKSRGRMVGVGARRAEAEPAPLGAPPPRGTRAATPLGSTRIRVRR
ncbi:MAG: serine/threonine protein kinase [Deltaproteobacteria bacterium]|nr:serine/threonine protein kinase [Deltaproteobacteria bacterium]